MSKFIDGAILYAWLLNKSFNTAALDDITGGTELPTVAGECIVPTDSDENVAYLSTDGATWNKPLYLGATQRYSNVYKVVTSVGGAKIIVVTQYGRTTLSAQDGNIHYIEITAFGGEGLLNLSTYVDTNKGKFDLYINGVLDSSYDDYAASPAFLTRMIGMTTVFKKGYNLIELRVNGQNAASSGYYLSVLGVGVQ
jgi:hypothetical protein